MRSSSSVRWPHIRNYDGSRATVEGCIAFFNVVFQHCIDQWIFLHNFSANPAKIHFNVAHKPYSRVFLLLNMKLVFWKFVFFCNSLFEIRMFYSRFSTKMTVKYRGYHICVFNFKWDLCLSLNSFIPRPTVYL